MTKTKRVKKLEDQNKLKNSHKVIIIHWNDGEKSIDYNNKNFSSKEELIKIYPETKNYTFIDIVWEDNEIHLENQINERVKSVLKDFDRNY